MGVVTMLSFHHLTLGHGSVTLLEDASLTLCRGEVVGLVAPNGFGKTTLLTTLAGMGGASARGEVCIQGVAPHDGADLRAKVFYAPGDASLLYPSCTALDHLRMARDLWSSPHDVETLARTCGVDPFLHKRVRSLSQGMKQQLTLAIAYATDAACLLLDEPMNALDPTNVQRNTAILRGLARRGKTIVMSSHILENVDEASDRIVFMTGKGLIVSDARGMGGERARAVYERLYGGR